MERTAHRASPMAWVFAAAAMAAAASLVILHWAPGSDSRRDRLEVAGLILLAVSVLATYLLEARRQRKLESFGGPS
jgi:hypothetical protein